MAIDPTAPDARNVQSESKRHHVFYQFSVFRLSAISVGFICAVMLTGCITIPVYDAKTDDMLTALQKDTDTYIYHLSDTYDTTTVDGKACAYPANSKIYDQFRLSIGLLKTRAAALYNNQLTVNTLVDLQDTFDKLEAAQKAANNRPDHCIIPQLLTIDQQALDSAIGVLLKLELQKKGSS